MVRFLSGFSHLLNGNFGIQSADVSTSLLYSLLDVLIGLILFKLCSEVQLRYPGFFAPKWHSSVATNENHITITNQTESHSNYVKSPLRERKVKPRSIEEKPQSSTEDSFSAPGAMAHENILQEYQRVVINADTEPLPALAIMAVYLLNPFTLASCLSRSTTLFSNFFIASSILSAFRERYSASALQLALASYLSVYPVLLVPSYLVLVYRISNAVQGQSQQRKGSAWKHVLQFKLSFAISLMALALISISLVVPFDVVDIALYEPHFLIRRLQSESSVILGYLKSTYGITLMISDLSINIGPYWYFFTEIFDQFRYFFVAVVQLHLLSFSVPYAIKFRFAIFHRFLKCLYSYVPHA